MTSLRIDNSAGQVATKPTFPPPSPQQQTKREAEFGKLGETLQNSLGAQFGEKAGYLLLGAMMKAQDSGLFMAPWPMILDSMIGSFREAAPAYGEALCQAAERQTVSTAKAQGLVDGSYNPPPKA
jgi:hypothetical protein